jgi:hypothetical protein
MKTIVALLLVLALVACSKKAPEPQAVPASSTSTARVATPWDEMKKDEQRAKDVQKQVDQQDARQRQQIDAAGQ